MLRLRLVFALAAVSLVSVVPRASAQLLAATDGPIVYGHHHLNTTDVQEQKRFFVNALGGTAVTIGTNNTEIVKFPNVLIFFRVQAPTGGSKGTTANHIGFSVPNIRAAVDKVKSNGFTMITSSEAPPDREVKDDIAAPPQPGGAAIAFVLGPDEVKVEFVEVKQQTAPIQLHHIHMFSQQNAEMRAWYAKTFGAKLRPINPASVFVTAELPGVAFNFTPVTERVAGTQGRAVDHIGFEVKNLEAFTKKLEADGIKLDRPYTNVAALGIAVAFFTDPWGTYIELTEGLDRVR
jgi:catechol 2,3-dioxygenase-like lactoylglutathione lyase family enzyme